MTDQPMCSLAAAEPKVDASLLCDGCGDPCDYNAPDFMVRPDYWSEAGRLTKGHINCIDSVWSPQDFER